MTKEGISSHEQRICQSLTRRRFVTRADPGRPGNPARGRTGFFLKKSFICFPTVIRVAAFSASNLKGGTRPLAARECGQKPPISITVHSHCAMVQSQLCKHSTWNMGLCIYVCSTHGCKHTSRAECLRRDALAARRPRPTRLTALPHVAIATKPPPASSPRHYTLPMARSCPSRFGENNVPKIIVDRLGESWPPGESWSPGAGAATKVASKFFAKVAP